MSNPRSLPQSSSLSDLIKLSVLATFLLSLSSCKLLSLFHVLPISASSQLHGLSHIPPICPILPTPPSFPFSSHLWHLINSSVSPTFIPSLPSCQPLRLYHIPPICAIYIYSYISSTFHLSVPFHQLPRLSHIAPICSILPTPTSPPHSSHLCHLINSLVSLGVLPLVPYFQLLRRPHSPPVFAILSTPQSSPDSFRLSHLTNSYVSATTPPVCAILSTPQSHPRSCHLCYIKNFSVSSMFFPSLPSMKSSPSFRFVPSVPSCQLLCLFHIHPKLSNHVSSYVSPMILPSVASRINILYVLATSSCGLFLTCRGKIKTLKLQQQINTIFKTGFKIQNNAYCFCQ